MDIKEAEAIYPLSPAQEALLPLLRNAALAGSENQVVSCEIRGAVDTGLLERAMSVVTSRHPALRALVVANRVARPLVVVRRELTAQLVIEDVRDPSERDAALVRIGRDGRDVSADAKPVRLVRPVLVRAGGDASLCALVYHPIVLDEPSARQVLAEALRAYGALKAGTALDAPPAPAYSAFVAWLKGRDHTRAEAFWRGLLGNAPEATPLVVERGAADSAGRAPEERRCERLLSPDDTARLTALARDAGLALSTVVEGAWALLLSHYNDNDDVIFGVRISGRPSAVAGSEAMVGRFGLTLPVRVHVDETAPARTWLAQLGERRREVEAQQSSLAQLRVWLGLPPDRSLFESVVSTVTADGAPLGTVDSIAVGEFHASWTGDCTFELRARLADGRLQLTGMFDQARLEPAAAEQLLGGVCTILGGIARDPAQPVAGLPLLDSATLQNLLHDWNGPQPGYRESPTIHGLFEEQMGRTPDVIAVEYKGQTLSYRELNRRANQLAHYLRKLGVRREVLVANCMERSIEMVVGILGILKAGGAYVPIDPSYPIERLAFMLEDAKAPVMLTLERHRDELPSSSGHVVCLDTDWETIATNSDENPSSGSTGTNLSYIIYTSGSTGRPKGVMVQHRGVCSSEEYYARIIGMPPGSRMLQISSVGFDMCVFDIVPALTSGLTLVLADPDPPLGIDLLKVLQEEKIETISFPPSILATLPIVPIPTLKFIGVAGEAVSAELVARWAPGRRFYNAYGPAEGSVWVAGNFLDGTPPPVFGQAIDNVKVYLIDKHYRLVPVGVPGELCIGGDVQVSRGYLNRPGLTAERFFPDPFSTTPGARLYRTGDLARYLPSGKLEFLGRTDHQVKIRGFRVELGEIEAVFGHHPTVREAVVIAREDTPGDKRLVAYIHPHEGETPSTSELRSFIAEKLPENMVPSAFVVMDEFPLTPNGKVDRKALPAPDSVRPDLKDAYVAPRTPLEEVMVEIWTSVLGIDEVGVDDNFFELGGHSLLATQIISRLRDVFHIELPLTTIFQAPKISEIVKFVEKLLEPQK